MVACNSTPPSITQASLPLAEVPKGSSKAGDQGQGAKVAKGKRAGQGGSLLEAKGPEATLKLKDATSKAKNAAPKAKKADPKSKEANPKAPNPPVSQPGSKDDPPPAKA